MRIVAGSLKGRAIIAPEGQGTRPTSDRARQAIFNVLEHASWGINLHEARVLDLYAGSGALGFEALSRGASFALFVEIEDRARGAIRENMDAYGLFGRSRVHRRSATDLGPIPGSTGGAFDIVFMDPPYAKGLGEQSLKGLLEGGWLKPGALIIYERGSDEPDIDTPGYERLDARDYGAARVLFLKLADPA